MVRERVLVTGGSGFLGSNVARMTATEFEAFATYHNCPSQIPGCAFVPLDIRDRPQVVSALERIKPDVVIHTAALANVDYCEDHPEEARMTNVVGAENVAIASRKVGAKMVYISTDSVFDGTKGMYTEEDATHPLNTYARTKLEGEEKAQYWSPDCIVIRTAFYGWSPGNSNKSSLAEWVVSGLREGKTLPMFTDVFFSPIFISNLVEVMIEMYRKGASGVYHVGGSERVSKFAFGQEIARAFGLSQDYIRPSSITEVGLKAPRPRDISLNVAKVTRMLNGRLLNLKEGIARFKDEEPSMVKG